MDESVAYGAKIRATMQPSSLSFHNNAVRASSNPHAISRSCLPLPTFAIIPPSPVPPHRLHPRPRHDLHTRGCTLSFRTTEQTI
jgi:hypothetical protein